MRASTLGAALGETAAREQAREPDQDQDPARDADGARGVIFVDRRDRETHLSWHEIDGRATRAAAALAAAGVHAGDRVGIVLPTGVTFLDALFGCLRLGAIPVPLYPPMRLGKLDEYYGRSTAMLDAADATALIADRRTRRFLGEVRARVRRPLIPVAAEALAKGVASPSVELSSSADAFDPKAIALIQFSSGTTVAPKPVALSHQAVMANARAILDYALAAAGSASGGALVCVCWLPLYHDMGLIGCLLSSMMAGIRLVLIPPEDFLVRPAIWLRAISRYRGVVCPAPNFAYSLCHDRIKDADLDGVDLSSWRVAMNGAEPVSPSTVRAFTQRFARWGLPEDAVRPVYGLSEAALAVTFSPLDAGGMRTLRVDRVALAADRVVLRQAGDSFAGNGETVELVSVGPPLPGYRLEIRDAAGQPRPEGHVGSLWVAGPSLMSGYLDVTGGVANPIVDGWLDTGDRGVMVGGELFITGRDKDIIILRGQNHLPQDLEAALDDVDGVRKGCVVAVGELGDAGDKAERLLIFAETRAPTPELEQAIGAAVKGRTGLGVDVVVLLEPGTLPRTSSGKIRRRATLDQWRVGVLKAPTKVTRMGIAGEMAKNLIRGLKPR